MRINEAITRNYGKEPGGIAWHREITQVLATVFITIKIHSD